MLERIRPVPEEDHLLPLHRPLHDEPDHRHGRLRPAFAQMSFQPKHRGFPGTKSVTFQIPNTGNRNFEHGWGFTASIGGGSAHYVQMDTGSRGVVVPAAVLGPGAVGPGPPGRTPFWL